MKTKFTFLIFLASMSLSAIAQDSKPSNFNLSVGADLASCYLWRGIQQGTGPAIQPWGEWSYKGITLGAWGSYELNSSDLINSFKEVDLYAKYTYKDFSLLYVDLFFPDYVGLDQNYFNYKNATTGHASELALSFNGSESIPFSVYGGIILYGTAIDPKVADPTQLNNSTYFEVNYLGKFKDYSYNVFAGFTPTESYLYDTKEFSVFNVGVSAKKAIKVTTDFSIPLKLTLATNPVSKKAFIAAVISL
jgi:hypothetical protein